MKILHINSYYSSSSFYKNLYEKQRRSGLGISVYVPVPNTYDAGDLDFGEYTTISRNHGKYDRALFKLKHWKICNDIVKIYDPSSFSLIHAHSLFSNGYIAYRLKLRFGTPYVVAVRDTDVNVFFRHMIHLRNLGIAILREASRVVFLSESYRSFVSARYVPSRLRDEVLRKSEVIPNGIDDFWLENKGAAKTILGRRRTMNLLTVGTISKRKNQLTTARAIRLLQKRGLEVRYTAVGRVEDARVYRQIIAMSCVQHIPYTSKENLLSIYRENDIFVMPSITETFGLVYAEAMSQGLPIVYTRGQGFDKQFDEGEVGYSANCTDEREISTRIIDILSNYESLSRNAVDMVDKFNWRKICDRYADVYKDVLA